MKAFHPLCIFFVGVTGSTAFAFLVSWMVCTITNAENKWLGIAIVSVFLVLTTALPTFTALAFVGRGLRGDKLPSSKLKHLAKWWLISIAILASVIGIALNYKFPDFYLPGAALLGWGLGSSSLLMCIAISLNFGRRYFHSRREET